MPRFRFSWTNFTPDLLKAIAGSLSLSGDPAESLKSRYGARPKEEFIKDAWPVLLSTWLGTEPDTCSKLASSLRKRGLGQTDLSDDCAFLQSCRNTQSLRQEALFAFLQRGEQSQSAISSSVIRSSPRETSVNTQPRQDANSLPELPAEPDRSNLVSLAVEAAAELYGVSPDKIFIDEDGDVIVPCGSTLVFITVIENTEIRVFSVLVREPNACPEMYEVLNEINGNLKIGRIFYSSGVIVLEHNLRAQATNKAELIFAIDIVGDLADNFDHKLQERFGGTLYKREKDEDEISV